QARGGLGQAGEAEDEGRARQVEYEPCYGHELHRLRGDGGDLRRPEEAEVAVPERGKRGKPLRWRGFWDRRPGWNGRRHGCQRQYPIFKFAVLRLRLSAFGAELRATGYVETQHNHGDERV